ncbi:Guanylate cyclase [Seminavis robusta]|uniref:Guanylate cyclase n=1 Tax=Seminavis robusta TaxID=568900 RepID=A0A9N8DT27_9STRA|nr:Guanylate cyclase [Seminavis robusta]|eukprot:Sro322_g117080.1 Guanylate cyclase (475) ;mRNA; f:50696-52401
MTKDKAESTTFATRPDESGFMSNDLSVCSARISSVSEERDEIAEVHKFSRKETNHIRVWRLIMALVLLATAITVTLTTYHFLKSEQTKSFDEAFEKFSQTVADAALQSQEILHATQRDVCENMAVDAIRTGQTWRNYTNPYYEMQFGSARNQAKTELSAFFPFVEKDGRDAWIEYAGEHLTEWTHAGHMTKYGNLDRLNEINYVPNMTKKGPDGFIPDDEYPEYWPMWLYSPPPAQYGAVNWNVLNVPDYNDMMTAIKVVRGEQIISKVRTSVSTGTAFTEEEHAAMHSKLKTGSSPHHPHCFIWTPVYEDPQDIYSKFVGFLATSFAWDFSLRNLLPGNVAGIVVIITSTCNQTYTYEIAGQDAYYMGEGDLHEAKYDDYKSEINLSLLTHPKKDVTPGHCQYSMHIYPSSEFESFYDRNTPEIFAGIVAFTFTCIALVMIVYDILVHNRNAKLVANAARSNAVVTSLFPGSM